MKRMVALFLATSLAQTLAFAAIDPFDGMEMATIEVDGQSVTFPVGNDERKNQIYYLKKAIKGDKEAREVFMGGSDEKWFFIGRELPLWLKVTATDMEVINI